jgi:hypothetical protein
VRVVKERRLQEVALLRRGYGELENDGEVSWVLFKEFELPPGWNREKTELLILVPAGYPVTAPDNFYVTAGLKPASGGPLNNYTESGVTEYLGKKWGQFSYHIDDEWKPANDILRGDNLQTFMLKVMDRLRELN